MRIPRWFVSLAAAALSAAALAQAPQLPALDAAQKKQAVAELATLLKENYVFPDVAGKAAAFLQKQVAAGAYDQASDPGAFAFALTRDLQASAKDLHLQVRVLPPGEPPTRDDTPESLEKLRKQLRRQNFAFEKVEILPGNIGYLDLRMFAPPSMAGPTAVAAMNFLANCDALIVDLRKNGGGDPEMIQLLSTYLFDKPTHLNDLTWRQGNRTDQFWTLTYVPGPRLSHVPVYVLTSSETFSGAEEFTNNLKVLKRATVVGETTGGGANPGEGFPFKPFFQCFIPIGRAVNPTTGTNWEGVGVKPDIAVPAGQALVTARGEALKALTAKAEDPEAKARYAWAMAAVDALRNPATFTPGQLQAFAGTYGPRKVWVEEGKLVYQRQGRPKVTLLPMTGTTFAAAHADFVHFTFEPGPDGRAAKIVLTYDDGRRDESERTE